VESVAKNSESEKAGLTEGDVILSWTRDDVKGEIQSPFDLSEIEMEQAPRGAVTLEGLRGTEKRNWMLGPDVWGTQARPNFQSGLLDLYREGRQLSAAGKPAEAAGRWRTLASHADGPAAAWLLAHVADTFAEKRQWKEADDTYQEALETAKAKGSDPRIMASLLQAWAQTFNDRSDWKNAEKYYQQAIAEGQKLDRENLMIAMSLNKLGTIAWNRGDLLKAEEYYRQALDMRQKLAPESLAVAASFNNIGLVAWKRGDLAKAEQYYRQSLDIKQKLAPESLAAAASFHNLGNVARDRGDLAKAEQYFHQVLDITQKAAPGSLVVAASFNSLGNVARDRGDLAKAEQYFHQVLDITQKLASGSLAVAGCLNNLGTVASRRGDLAKAEQYYRQALEIRQKLGPGSLDVAISFGNLGDVAKDRKDLTKAEEYYRQSLEIAQKLAPGSLEAAMSFGNLGDLAKDRKDLTKAEEYYQKALIIREKLAPESTEHAETLAALAGIALHKQQLDAAAQMYEQALRTLEGQVAQMGGAAEVRSGFRAQHQDYYKDYIDVLVKLNQPEKAFAVVERSRARGLLETLAAAHVDIRTGGDPALIAKERSLQNDIQAKTERRARLLSEEHGGDQSVNQSVNQIKAVEKEIGDLTSEYQDAEAQLRSSSPVYAALTQLQPLSAGAIQQQLLDNYTMLLEYALGEKRSFLFALTPTSLDSYELPKRSEIEDTARHLYDLLTTRNRWVEGETSVQRKARLAKDDAEYKRTSATLSQMLLGPIAPRLASTRLLIVADGALQYISFAALPVPASDTSKADIPLVAEHEIVNLPSASVLALLRRQASERGPRPKEVAILADPVFDKNDPRVGKALKPASVDDKALDSAQISESTEHLTRSIQDVGSGTQQPVVALSRLAFSRHEAAAIMAAAKPGTSMEALGFQASRETTLSKELRQYRIVHFATHGFLDNEHPGLSGLVLSLVNPAGQPEDGFVDLQDVYNLTLPADLVVLSACKTALGKEIGGEGLVGLTRGFMYAGASRVLASLWNVDDVATSELMALFYKGMLQAGLPPAAALRHAQLEMQKRKRWADPYYWAGFTLQGEWK